jgi:hypothetical protein
MKKVIIITSLMLTLFSKQINAQWTGSTVSTNTNSDVRIKATTSQGNLTLLADPITLVGLNLSYPKPALTIQKNTNCLPFGGSPVFSNTIRPIFEIVDAQCNSLGNNIGYNTPIFTVGGDCQLKVGSIANLNFDNTINGRTILQTHTLMRGKVRLTNNAAVLAAPDWSNTTFPYTFSVDAGNSRFVGKVQIGNLQAIGTYTNYALSVDGNIICKRMVVQSNSWADFVFNDDYKLMSLQDVSKFILKNKHLPNIPSAENVLENGIDVCEMNKLLLQKIEELTLYMIELKKENEAINSRLNNLNRN